MFSWIFYQKYAKMEVFKQIFVAFHLFWNFQLWSWLNSWLRFCDPWVRAWIKDSDPWSVKLSFHFPTRAFSCVKWLGYQPQITWRPSLNSYFFHISWVPKVFRKICFHCTEKLSIFEFFQAFCRYFVTFLKWSCFTFNSTVLSIDGVLCWSVQFRISVIIEEILKVFSVRLVQNNLSKASCQKLRVWSWSQKNDGKPKSQTHNIIEVGRISVSYNYILCK